ncbi:MAG: hypothetical protein AAGK14_08760 [Verrucomicrobiota bacterium]
MDQNLLPPKEEWDFRGLAREQEYACYAYEFSRESQNCLELVEDFRKEYPSEKFSAYSKEQDRILNIWLNRRLFWAEDRRILPFVVSEWPHTPWRGLSRDSRQSAIKWLNKQSGNSSGIGLSLNWLLQYNLLLMEKKSIRPPATILDSKTIEEFFTSNSKKRYKTRQDESDCDLDEKGVMGEFISRGIFICDHLNQRAADEILRDYNKSSDIPESYVIYVDWSRPKDELAESFRTLVKEKSKSLFPMILDEENLKSHSKSGRRMTHIDCLTGLGLFRLRRKVSSVQKLLDFMEKQRLRPPYQDAKSVYRRCSKSAQNFRSHFHFDFRGDVMKGKLLPRKHAEICYEQRELWARCRDYPESREELKV